MTVASSRLDAEGLLERDTELASVDRALDRMGAGLGSVVLVEGPAGIGKSALLAAAGARAQARGFAVLRARGSEFEQEIAFGLARQLFEPMLRMASAAERRRLLAGVAEVGARALGVQAGDAPVDQFAAIHGLFWLCANWIERSPLVVAVDDVQWGDDPSLPGWATLHGGRQICPWRCCWLGHQIVSGTGAFQGATGRIDFTDDVTNGTSSYRGHIHLTDRHDAGHATALAATAEARRHWSMC